MTTVVLSTGLVWVFCISEEAQAAMNREKETGQNSFKQLWTSSRTWSNERFKKKSPWLRKKSSGNGPHREISDLNNREEDA
jgi:hypothetical protein